MARIIGIVHRRKRTKDEEARPTRVAILKNDQIKTYELANEDEEMDFVKGNYPTKYRRVAEDEDMTFHNPDHCKWRKPKLDERELLATLPAGYIRDNEIISHVPVEFEGIKNGDTVVMMFGGSGDILAGAISIQGEKLGVKVYRVSPHIFKEWREAGDLSEDKSKDHELLARSFTNPHNLEFFHDVRPLDRHTIRVKQLFKLRDEAMKARIGCEQRIIQRAIGQTFLSEDGWPEGRLADHYKKLVANDAIYQQLEAIEKQYEREMRAAVRQHPAWPIFEAVRGCGERIAAGIIGAIGDIRRFQVKPDPVRMKQLYKESELLQRQGNFIADCDKIIDRLQPGDNEFRKLQLVRSWKRANGKEAEAIYLDQAIECHKERAILRRQTLQKGKAKLKAFCGVYPQVGGKFGDNPPGLQFPRFRTGKSAKYNPLARQALYLLADQFNRNPATPWGSWLRDKKIKLRQVHPEPVQVETEKGGKKTTKTRYSDGHIHKMALWSTVSKFIEFVFVRWSRLDAEHERRNNSDAAAA